MTLPSGDVVLTVGKTSSSLDHHLVGQGYQTWLFITAWNPWSQPQSEAENDRRQRELREALRKAGCDWLPARGVGQGGEWPPEESLLVPGIARSEAVCWGQRFQQNAVVFGEIGQPAELLWCLADSSGQEI